MISDHDLAFQDSQSSTYQKVTRRIVDPITFSCHANMAYIPRIEDYSYETTNIALSQPRFGEKLQLESPFCRKKVASAPRLKKKPLSEDADSFWTPQEFPTNKPLNAAQVKPSGGTPALFASSGSSNKFTGKSRNSIGKSSENKATSLGAFFSRNSQNESVIKELDNMSVGSKSIGSRSISDLSHADRSKAEEKLKKSKKRSASRFGSSASLRSRDMMSIDERGSTDFLYSPGLNKRRSQKKLIPTKNFLPKVKVPLSPSAVPLQSSLKKSNSKSSSKKVFISEDQIEVIAVNPLNDKEYYEAWDDIWYSEESLGDFRYEAFLEEAGLSLEEYS